MIRHLLSNLCTIGLAASLAAPAWSQETGTVTGRVFARTSGTRFAAARVRIVGAEGGERTDSAGRYFLPQVPGGSREVEVTIVGYGTVLRRTTVVPGDTTRLDFDLLPASIEPDFVLEGVGGEPVRRREVGQSVAVVTGQELDASLVTTLTEALQGRLPGVLVLDASGWAGAGRQLQLRGAGSFFNTDRPLVFVDGVRVADLPYPAGMGSTQTADPLDDIDPATIDRIEVMRGPSAASRYGREGANGVIHVFTRRGTPGRPMLSFSADQGAEWFGHVGPGSDNPDGLGLNDCRLAPGCPTDHTWLRSGHDQRYRASVSGGSEGVVAGYFASGTWGREAGVIAPQYGAAGSGRGNLTLRPLPSLEVAAAVTYAEHRVRWIPSLFLSSVLSGDYVFFPGENDSLFLLTNLDQKTTHRTGAVNVGWAPVTGLRHSVTLGLDRAQSRYLYDQPAGVPFPSAPAAVGTEGYHLRTLTADYAGSWDLWLGNVRSRFSWGAGLRKRTLDDSAHYESGGGFAGSASHSENTIRGLSLEERLGVADRLFLTGGVRWDDATKTDTTGLEAFPGAQLSYLVSKSASWPRWWGSLQLRVAIGSAGSPLRPWMLPPLFSPGPAVPPPPIGLEHARELEIGLQSSWLGGRVGLEYSYYAQRTSDVQALVSINSASGFFSGLRSVGAITNRGHEALLSVSVLRGSGVAWDVGAHWFTNHSEASDTLPYPVSIIGGWYGGPLESMRDSLPVPSYYGYVVTNPDEVGAVPVQQPGAIGPVNPTFAYGLTTRLSLGGRVVLTALGEGQGGHRLASVTASNSARLGTWPACYDIQDQIVAGDVLGLTAGQRAQCDRQFESLAAWTLPAGFFRLRQASLLYRLPRSWVPGAHSAWLGVAARNLFLLTSYAGLDPEAVTGGSTEGTFAGGVRAESFELPHPRHVEVSLRVEW